MNSGAIIFQGTELRELNSKFVEDLASTTVPKYSQPIVASQPRERESSGYRGTTINDQIFNQQERTPIEVNKYIFSYCVDNDYRNQTICIMVECINRGDTTLDNIDLYEVIPDGAIIINCSSPLKTSSIEELMRYERKGPLLICSEDISNSRVFAKILTGNLPISCHLRKNGLNINSSICDPRLLAKNITKGLNDIIANKDLNLYKNKTGLLDDRFLSLQTRKLNSTLSNILWDIDGELLNFFFLRDSYPSNLRKPDGNAEIVDKYSIDEMAGFIHIPDLRLRQKEILMFRYFMNISDYGTHTATTIVHHSDIKLLDSRKSLEISFPSPEFHVQADLPKENFKPGEPINVTYIVDLLSPNHISSEYEFNAHIESHGCNISDDMLNFRFSKEKAASYNSTVIRINESGKYNIPSITINGINRFVFDKNISVEEPFITYILVLTLMFLGFFTLIGGNLEHIEKKMIFRIIYLIAAILSIVYAIRLTEMSDSYIWLAVFLGLLIFVYWIKRNYNINITW